MSYMKSAGTAAKGNDRLLKSYGGSSGASPMARQHYASGGAVKGGNPSLSEGLSAADGAPAKPSLSRPGRKAPGKGKDGGKKGTTTVNIVIAGKPDAGGPPKPAMDAGPPMPPPGPPGGPPMPPMRKHGGAVGRFAKGGRVKKADGGETVEPRKRAAGELDEGAQRDYLKREANNAAKYNDAKVAGGVGATGLGLGTAAAHIGNKFGRPGRLGGLAAAALGVKSLMSAGEGEIKKKKLDAEAKEFDKADMAERKSGGRIGNLGKFAWGGKVQKKADGGWTGEGDSGKTKKEESANLSDKASTSRSYRNVHGGLAASNLGFAAVPPLKGKGSLLNLGIGAFNSLAAKKYGENATSAQKQADEANKAGDEAEGRKFGGRAKSTTKGDEASKIAKDEESYATGGKVGGGEFHGLKNSDGGAMSGKGRLAKIKMYK